MSFTTTTTTSDKWDTIVYSLLLKNKNDEAIIEMMRHAWDESAKLYDNIDIVEYESGEEEEKEYDYEYEEEGYDWEDRYMERMQEIAEQHGEYAAEEEIEKEKEYIKGSMTKRAR